MEPGHFLLNFTLERKSKPHIHVHAFSTSRPAAASTQHMEPEQWDDCKDPSGTLPLVWILGVLLRKMLLGSDLCTKRDSNRA